EDLAAPGGENAALVADRGRQRAAQDDAGGAAQLAHGAKAVAGADALAQGVDVEFQHDAPSSFSRERPASAWGEALAGRSRLNGISYAVCRRSGKRRRVPAGLRRSISASGRACSRSRRISDRCSSKFATTATSPVS